MPNRTPNQFNADHDLLIRLDTKVDNLTSEIVMLRDSTSRRVDELGRTKVDLADHLEFKKHIELELTKASTFGSESLAKYRDENDKRVGTYEERLRGVESKIAYATGIIVAAQVAVGILLRFIL
jgi:hypothetical protein